MKKKKAFTLIELLAVIVILAIILVIAVPKISNAIENSKKGALESSAKIIARDVERKYESSFATGIEMSVSGSCMDGLNTNEYSDCTYEINNNGKASVTLTGSGKFEGYTCTGDKNYVICTLATNNATVLVTFDKGGDTSSIPPKEVLVGNKYGSLPLPTKDNKVFLGWYTDEAFTNKVTNTTIVSNNVDHTLFAKYGKAPILSYNWVSRLTTANSNITEETIGSVTFHDTSVGLTLPDTYADVSSSVIGGNGALNENVFAYYTLNNSLYDIDIVADSKIYFPSNSNSLFSSLTHVLSLNFNDSIDTSNVTDMSYMFNDTGYSSPIFTLNVSHFDTSNVTNMSYMFYDTGYNSTAFTLDVSHFDTSNVTNMLNMFYETGYNSTALTLDVSHFDTSNVTNMSGMFEMAGCNSTIFTLDVSHFDTSNVTNMQNMFLRTGNNSTTFTLDVSHFDTSNVTNMAGMFQLAGYKNTAFTLDVSHFDTSNVTDMSNMFYQTGYKSTVFTLDVSHFDTSNVTNMSWMFYRTGYNSTALTLDVSHFDTSNVTNMSNMFWDTGYNSTNLNTSITILNPNVTSYTYMFNGAVLKTGSQITVNYTAETESLVDAMIATKSSSSHVVKGSLISAITPTINTANIVAAPASAYPNAKVVLSSTGANMVVTSFKLNGTLVEGDTFSMPSTGAVITDVTTVEGLIVETSHNPYEDNINNVIYGEKTFSGATSLKVILDYQTQGVSSDWLYIYGANSYKSEKYGGTTRTSKVIIIPGNYIKFEFKSNGGSNNYYGFKATVIPIY